jgi:hypothetical protein
VRPAIARCDGVLKADTRVIVERESVTPSSNFRIARIAELAKHSGPAPDSAPPGFYTAQTAGVGVDHSVAGAWPPHIKVELHPQLARRRIEIGQEVVNKTCLCDIGLDHYRKKAAADAAPFAVHVDQIGAALRATSLSIAIGHADTALGETTRTEVEHWVKPIVVGSRQQFHDARIAAWRAVNPPDESRRLSRACGRDA